MLMSAGRRGFGLFALDNNSIQYYGIAVNSIVFIIQLK